MVKVLITEDIPSLNKGEEAILRGIQKVFNSIHPSEFALLSTSVEDDKKHYSDLQVVDVFDKQYKKSKIYTAWSFITFVAKAILERSKGVHSKSAPTSVFDYYQWADILLMGHDDTLCGSKFPIRILRDVIIGKLLNKPVVMLAGSFIKPKSFISQLIARISLSLFDVITLREELSEKHLLSLGIAPSKFSVTTDLAFLVDPESHFTSKTLAKYEGSNRPVIGVTAVRGSAVFSHAFKNIDIDFKDEDEKHWHHVRELAEAFDRVVEEINCVIVFLPHCIGPQPKYDDRIVAEDIQSAMKHSSSVEVLTEDLSAAELKKLISKLDLMIGERTHSIIQALAVEVPSLSISFPQDNRTMGIIGITMGQKDWIFNVENLSSAALSDHILKLWSNKEEVANNIKNRLPEVIAKAKSNIKLVKPFINHG